MKRLSNDRPLWPVLMLLLTAVGVLLGVFVAGCARPDRYGGNCRLRIEDCRLGDSKSTISNRQSPIVKAEYGPPARGMVGTTSMTVAELERRREAAYRMLQDDVAPWVSKEEGNP